MIVDDYDGWMMIHDDGKHLFKCISPFQKTYQVLALEQAWSSCLQKAILPVNVSTSESQKCAPVCHVMCHIYHECNMFDRNIRIVIIQYYMVFTFILLYSACLYTYLYIYIYYYIFTLYTLVFRNVMHDPGKGRNALLHICILDRHALPVSTSHHKIVESSNLYI